MSNLFLQSQQGELDSLNQRVQEILRQADSENRTRIEQENTDVNSEWKRIVTELETRIDIFRDLSKHWENFDKRIREFENQLARLDERNRNVDSSVKSRQHLEETKNVVRVSKRRSLSFDYILCESALVTAFRSHEIKHEIDFSLFYREIECKPNSLKHYYIIDEIFNLRMCLISESELNTFEVKINKNNECFVPSRDYTLILTVTGSENASHEARVQTT